MAPGALVAEGSAAGGAAPNKPGGGADEVPRSIFPDGIRTSGQHNPQYEKLRPYSDFPKEITGPTVWTKEELEGQPERWVHRFSDEEVRELSDAADAFIASGTPLTGISKESFPLPPRLSGVLAALRKSIIDGRGFVLFRGFPADRWGPLKNAVGYMGLGTYLGYFVSQNGRGHVLGHVKDLGEDPTKTHEVRIYRTTARQFFHTDDGDIVGLLCVHRALEGGESDVVSTHNLWNALQREHPDVAELLTRPVWHVDRKGEVSQGQGEYTRQPIMYLEPTGPGSKGRVCCKYDPYFIRSLGRFSDRGEIPPLSPEQTRAMDIIEETCLRLALHMVLEVGDIQFLSDCHILHARTAYKDYPAPAPRRHLLRLWLATPEGEGGWALPFHDSHERKRGGIQVNNNAPTCPLDAE